MIMKQMKFIFRQSVLAKVTSESFFQHTMHVDSQKLAMLLHVWFHGQHVSLPSVPVFNCVQMGQWLHCIFIPSIDILQPTSIQFIISCQESIRFSVKSNKATYTLDLTSLASSSVPWSLSTKW